MLESTIRAAILSPLAGTNPCGESLRYDEAWAALEAEVGKLENPAGGEVDWKQVEQGATRLLAERGKDLLLMAWLARASFHRDGPAGLASGLELLRDALAAFWEGVHPQRPRARRAALEWLGDKLVPVMEENQVRGYPEEVARCQAAITAISVWGTDRFEGEDCGLMGLLVRFNELSAGPAGAPVAAGGEPVAEAPSDAPVVAGKAAAGPIANRAQAVARLKEVGDWFARHEPLSPLVPLLRRAESWSRKDFQAVFNELLHNRQDARDHVWDVLGLVETPPQ